MKDQEEIQRDKRILICKRAEDGGCGWVLVGNSLAMAPFVVWSIGGGWDHVSVSFSNRCPTWEEMCRVKDAFFREDECCVEYHPKKSDYVNNMPYCLHIWRPQNADLPTPPKIFV